MTEPKNIEQDDFQSMYDAEEDMYMMELNMSQHSEAVDNGPSEGPQEPELASADMPIEQYDPQCAYGIPQDGSLCEIPAEVKMAQEMEELALAEPEPPEGIDVI